MRCSISVSSPLGGDVSLDDVKNIDCETHRVESVFARDRRRFSREHGMAKRLQLFLEGFDVIGSERFELNKVRQLQLRDNISEMVAKQSCFHYDKANRGVNVWKSNRQQCR